MVRRQKQLLLFSCGAQYIISCAIIISNKRLKMSHLLKHSAVRQLLRTGNNFNQKASSRTIPALQILRHRNQTTAAESNAPPSAPTTDDEWLPIYRLPLARWAAAFNRLKIYQTLVTAVGTPTIYALEQFGQVSPSTAIVVGAIGCSGILTLTLASFGAQNLVGFLYLNEAEDKLKLSYVDFWGLRRDVVYDVEDLIPNWEQKNPSRFNFYQAIRLHSDEQRKFKLLQRFGVIVEPEKFTNLFGE